MTDTILFDLDGTLLNTLEDIADGVNHALRKMNFPERTLEEVRQFVGNGVVMLIKRAVPDGTSEELTNTCLTYNKEYYSTHVNAKTRPYEGIMPLLKELKEKGYKVGVVSNKYDSAVKDLSRLYFSDYIGIAVGNRTGVPTKPAPDCVYSAMEELGSSPEATVFVGDSDVDVRTAHNAGLTCIGVSWGFRGRAFLEKAGADIVIDSPGELLTLLESGINSK
ncbi:HAD family hydrolase [Anaerocolumna xylanovorans]|uniref:Phosphoglycolate phosphatase n=1 Tax=Anaerocolumna xylanovorans DSM 12503 TaxID=1121345 RepID=A0A1M7Y2H7_9FIRM|nr:HAD-IIIA family hydrolase [Anaerocolumna xylanovorans]SHO46150.1 phosphoglycolate phosphatase [Anaerocolumna xylanovorans DSM 12503]